ncbi:hypothetical protein C8F04DRAFT_1192946 [Mycena alexandri]|uniref:Uncharacterized protein n=1 Tax=Mycena alexandri TaxID=1745969 RepID=A0AAD6WWN5_9AGAR|nr:hypothetical protein C8F04DRAFT_1192946 [Mycena alexandri]
MANGNLNWIWPQYTISPDPASGMQSLSQTCSMLYKHVLQPTDIILSGGGFVLHPNLAEPLSRVMPAMIEMLALVTKYSGLRSSSSLSTVDLHVLTTTTGLVLPATQNQIVLNWVILADELYIAMADLETFRVGYSVPGSIDEHGKQRSRMPKIIAALPYSLAHKLPKDFLKSYHITLLPPPANMLLVPQQKKAFVESCRRHRAEDSPRSPSSPAPESKRKDEHIPLRSRAQTTHGVQYTRHEIPWDETEHGKENARASAESSVAGGDDSRLTTDISSRNRLMPTYAPHHINPERAIPASSSALLSPATPASSSILRALMPESTRKAQSSSPRSVVADPLERSTSATSPSVRALVARIESALAVEHGAAASNESVPRAQLAPKSPAPAPANANAVERGGLQFVAVGRRAEGSTAERGEHTSATAGEKLADPRWGAHLEDSAVEDEPGGRRCESAKLFAPVPDTDALTLPLVDKVYPVRSRSRLGDNAPTPTHVSPPSKSPAPALAIADAVELGGLQIGAAEPRANAPTMEDGGRGPVSVPRQQAPARWMAWQAAEARRARVQTAAATSTARLTSILRSPMFSSVTASGSQAPLKDHGSSGINQWSATLLEDDVRTVENAQTNTSVSFSSSPRFPSPCSPFLRSLATPARLFVVDHRTFALDSAIVRTQVISYLVWILREEIVPQLQWDREGIDFAAFTFRLAKLPAEVSYPSNWNRSRRVARRNIQADANVLLVSSSLSPSFRLDFARGTGSQPRAGVGSTSRYRVMLFSASGWPVGRKE